MSLPKMNGGINMTLQTNPAERREVVRAISERLGSPAVYLRTPTCAYRIGSLTVERDGSIASDDDALLETLRPMLMERGWLTDAASDSEADPGKDGNWLEITDGEEMTETETEKDKEEQKEDVIIETASDSNADQGQISYENVYWGLTGAGGRLVDENGIEKNQLQRERGKGKKAGKRQRKSCQNTIQKKRKTGAGTGGLYTSRRIGLSEIL